jgi:nitronate monooxygenase
MLPIRRAAAQRGNADRLNLWSGQAAPLTRPRTAAEYLETLVRDAGEALAPRRG